jgi:LacI family transcriptional regulator
MAVTLAELAEHAGVSIATASRALNGAAGVRPETSNRVQETAIRLGYRPAHQTPQWPLLRFTGRRGDSTALCELISALGAGSKVMIG